MRSSTILKNENIIEGEERKLTFGEKFAVIIPNGTGTFHFQMIQMFLLFFYTDVMKISAAYIAGLFLFTRIFDAFLAPAFGIFVDKITTPWGKYKPWWIAVGLGAGVFGWLTFTDFGLSGNAKVVYATITYVLYSVAMAIGAGPGAAITPAVTKRIDDRMSMMQISFVFVMVGALVASIFVQPLYKVLGGGNDAKGFSIIMGIFAVFSLILSVYQMYAIKERYIVQPEKNEKGPSLKEMFRAVITNKTAMIVYLFVFATNLAAGIRSGATIYYFKYFFHNENLLAITGMVALVPTFIGVAFSSKFVKRFGLRKTLFISAIFNVVGSAYVIILPASSMGITIFIVVSIFVSLMTGIANPAQGTMMPAAMDYTEWKSKMNINGFMGSFSGFLGTFATALSGAAAAGMLSVIGYVPGAADQSSATIFGLKLLMSIVPAVITVLTLSVIWFDLTEEKQAQITKELAERRKNAEGNATV